MPKASKPLVFLALSPFGVANALGIRPEAVNEALRNGKLTAYTNGIRVRILCSEVERWVKTWPKKSYRKPKKECPDGR